MSFALRQLSKEERGALIGRLWQRQNGQCYISQLPIDLQLHDGSLDIDHIIPTRDNGADAEENWALTFSSFNRSKQAADLRVARILARWSAIRDTVSDVRGANLGHVLMDSNGSKYPLPLIIESERVRYSLPHVGKVEAREAPLFTDTLSGMRSVFLTLPIEYLFHDDKLNPRSIGSNLRGLLEEFFKKRPQLHVPLGWVDCKEKGGPRVRLFDGQHKAAAQVLLGVRTLPVRIFIDPDPDALLTANTNAGTVLRQVAFDKSTQRHLGARILWDRVERFRADRTHPADYESFTEQQLVDHFKGEQASIRKYILDAQRTAITDHADNKLRDYIESAGKSADRPFSYSAIEKAVYSQFIYGGMLDTPWNHQEDVGENPRTLEREQLVRLLNLVADKIYIGQYDLEAGGAKIESRVQKGEAIDDNHLRAHRMAREEILSAWIGKIRTIAQLSFTTNNLPFYADRPLQRPFPETLWTNLENYLVNLARLPLWRDHGISNTVFGGKQGTGFWREVFETGTAPNGTAVLPPGGLNLMVMMQTPS
ncbi:MAG TPA: HNH endonuclease [Allosphingosinicella sp.]|jgi:hypothetical protein